MIVIQKADRKNNIKNNLKTLFELVDDAENIAKILTTKELFQLYVEIAVLPVIGPRIVPRLWPVAVYCNEVSESDEAYAFLLMENSKDYFLDVLLDPKKEKKHRPLFKYSLQKISNQGAKKHKNNRGIATPKNSFKREWSVEGINKWLFITKCINDWRKNKQFCSRLNEWMNEKVTMDRMPGLGLAVPLTDEEKKKRLI